MIATKNFVAKSLNLYVFTVNTMVKPCIRDSYEIIIEYRIVSLDYFVLLRAVKLSKFQ